MTSFLLPHLSSSLTDSVPSLNLLYHSKTDARFIEDGPKAVWSIPYVSLAFFPSLKHNFIAYRSFKMSSRPDCIFKIHQLWESGFSRVYSNSCCSCSFEPEIIRIGQSSHKMYSNNIVNFQKSTTILNACTKKSGNLLKAPHITDADYADDTHTHTHTYIYIYVDYQNQDSTLYTETILHTDSLTNLLEQREVNFTNVNSVVARWTLFSLATSLHLQQPQPKSWII